MSKPGFDGQRIDIAADTAISTLAGIFQGRDCSERVALPVAEHLADAKRSQKTGKC